MHFRPKPVAALAFALALAAPGGLAAAPPATRNLTFTANMNEYPPAPGASFGAGYSACWSYIHGDGREYAILGTTNGTAIYNVTNPYAIYRVALIPGPESPWREMKSYRNWIYIVTEGFGTGTGLQIVRMTNPEAPVLATTYTASFVTAHTIAIDTTRALLICNGTRSNSGQATGMRILTIQNPEAPFPVGWWPGGALPVSSNDYVHDSVPVGNRLYAASIYPGIQRVLDFTNPAGVTEINSWTYPGGFTHNCWPDVSGNWLYVTDEVDGEPLKIFDISNVMNPVLVNAITSNPHAIVHNAHVKGGELYLSNYTEGIRLLDLEDPAHPAEFGWADSYPGPSGGFSGVWEVCPFFPSGTVIASDMQTGLYVYRPVRDYGIVRARVVDGAALPVPGIEVFSAPQSDSLTTPADGIVQFAPGPGPATVTARQFGYYDASANVDVTIGSRDTVTLTLLPRPARGYAGRVRHAVGGTPLMDADVTLVYTPLAQRTDVSGDFAFVSVPQDVYQVEARCPGHRPLSTLVHLDPTWPPQHDIQLLPAATWDAFEVASGWTVGGAGTGDNATSGVWARVEPVGTGVQQPAPLAARRPRRLPVDAPPGGFGARLARDGGALGGPIETAGAAWPGPMPLSHPDHEHEHEDSNAIPGDVQPEFDRSPPPGEACWVTGQATAPGNVGESDVDGGRTTLTSPALDVTGMTEPTIGYWRWLYASGASDDWLAVLISGNNGANWVSVDTTRGFQNHWEERTIRVADYVTPSTQVRVRFIAADLNPGSVVEAAIDDFIIYDAALPNVGVPGTPAGAPRALRLSAPRPNPSRAGARFTLEMPRAGEALVEVLDLAGRRVRTLHRGPAPEGPLALTWDGADALGRSPGAGLYFVRATACGERAEARLVRIE